MPVDYIQIFVLLFNGLVAGIMFKMLQGFTAVLNEQKLHEERQEHRDEMMRERDTHMMSMLENVANLLSRINVGRG